MALNFLGAHIYGGGPAHLFTNPAPRSCMIVSSLNVIITAGAFTSILYGNYANTSYGTEVPHYLFAVAAANCYSAVYFARLAIMREGSDNEWSRILLTTMFVNLLQYGLIIWGTWLCYRMVYSKALVGTKMYYYFKLGRWMYNSILGISVLNTYCIVYTTYVSLVRILVALVVQRSKKKYAI